MPTVQLKNKVVLQLIWSKKKNKESGQPKQRQPTGVDLI
jgi:hypothetical protein